MLLLSLPATSSQALPAALFKYLSGTLSSSSTDHVTISSSPALECSSCLGALFWDSCTVLSTPPYADASPRGAHLRLSVCLLLGFFLSFFCFLLQLMPSLSHFQDPKQSVQDYVLHVLRVLTEPMLWWSALQRHGPALPHAAFEETVRRSLQAFVFGAMMSSSHTCAALGTAASENNGIQ